MGKLVAVAREDLLRHLRLLLAGGVVQPQQQDASMVLPRAVDHLAKVFIHGHNQPSIPRCPRQDVIVAHSGVHLAHCLEVVSRSSQPIFYEPPDPDVSKHPQPGIHGTVTA
jgi:hypothetical protein